MKTNRIEPKSSQEFLQASQTKDHDVIVVANAGTGKTRLLVEHYYELLTAGFEPASILTFTFTEKAAKELRERIITQLPTHPSFRGLDKEILRQWREKLHKSSIGTIHQFCLSILQEARDQNRGKDYQVIDEATDLQWRETLLRNSLRQHLERREPDILMLLETYGIGKLRRLLRQFIRFQGKVESNPEISPPVEEEDEKKILDALNRVVTPILNQLNAVKESRCWVTFDDLEKKALKAVEKPSNRLEMFLRTFSHILVDEFQDTSPIQIQIIEAIRNFLYQKKKSPALFCVGDPKQSIYRFRNVDRRLIENTEKKIILNGGLRFNFIENYRSTPEILQLLNAFTTKAFPEAIPSQAIRQSVQETRVLLVPLFSQNEKVKAEIFREREAAWIAEEIQKRMKRNEPLEGIAVIYRASASAIPLIRQLKQRNVSYTIRGGRELLRLQPIQDLKHLLYFLDNPKDDLSLVGILRSPIFLISDASLYFLKEGKIDESLFSKLLHGECRKNLKNNFAKEINKIQWAANILQRLLTKSKASSAYTLLRELVDGLDLNPLYSFATQDNDAELAIEQFLDWIKNIEEENAPFTIAQMVAILKQLEKTSVQKAPLGDLLEKANCVQLLTIHAAKGLQFETVFLMGLNRGTMPMTGDLQKAGSIFGLKLPETSGDTKGTPRFEYLRDYHQKEEQEENKRLLYVALSRAKQNLIATLAPSPLKNSLQSVLLQHLGNRALDFQIAVPQNFSNKNSALADAIFSLRPSLPDHGILRKPITSPRVTVSELETFAACPLKHHFNYGQGISEEKWDVSSNLSKTEMGTLLHSALNFLHQYPEKSPRDVVKLWLSTQNLWTQEEAVAVLSDYLENYIKSPLYEKILHALEDYSELPFLLNLQGGRIRGQIDRLIRTHTGWRLVDFKLTSAPQNPGTLLKAYGFQLKTYGLAAMQFLNGIVPELEIHLLSSPTAYCFKFKKAELLKQKAFLESLLATYQNPPLGEVTFREECHRCPYRHHIPICPIPQGRTFPIHYF